MNISEDIVKEHAKKGLTISDAQNIKSGKEADVYRVVIQDTFYALKIYKDFKERAFQNDSLYLEGKFYKQPSIRKAIAQKTQFGARYVYKRWVKREYNLLKKLFESKASIPEVYHFTDTTILMEYIGASDPAPRLIDIALQPEQQQYALNTLLQNFEIFLQNGIVHADLSPYNILWFQNKVYIIDFPQAVDIRNNPNAAKLLKHDLDTLVEYFKDIDTNKEEIYLRLSKYLLDS